MDATQVFLAFTLLTTGGPFKIQALKPSPLYCQRLVPPVITSVLSPCTFPCVLRLSEAHWNIVLQSESDGTPCRGGLCASGICKPTPSFQGHNRFQQDFISLVMQLGFGFGFSDTKANRQRIPELTISSHGRIGETDALMNTERKLGLSDKSGVGGGHANASGIKHIAGSVGGRNRRRFIYGDGAISGVSVSSVSRAGDVQVIEGTSGLRRQKRALQGIPTSPNDYRYKKLLEEIGDDSDEIIALPGNRGGADNWTGLGNRGGAGGRIIWDPYRYGRTFTSPFESGRSSYSTGRHHGLGGGRALAMLAGASLMGGSGHRGSSAIHGVPGNRGTGIYGRISNRSPSFGSTSSGSRSISRGATGLGGRRIGSSSHGGSGRGGGGRGRGGGGRGGSCRGGGGRGARG
ncbi:keratin, type I cytoskeletal 9-like [Dermacentor silvarum]|uniref:keratin, type I cytoskeletal 9-like n=1 Tax=Dermacentor silvarum TaxID=543639 RepID=UPI00189C038D|nr:keratin, type I cytoskeletal 9-like [Dermacentor silvarum]